MRVRIRDITKTNMNKMKMNTSVVGAAVVALIIGIGIGYVAHPSATPTQQNTRGSFSGAGGGGFGGARSGAGGMLSGTVAAKDSESITINTRDGSSHVVLVTPNTTVSKSVTGSQSDVTVGANVMISGTTNSDGSVSASVIQLRPATPPATVQ